MSRGSGAWFIARLNWPWYAAAVATLGAGLALLRAGAVPAPWRGAALVGLACAGFWLLSSLAVAHYVYDASAVARGEWLRGIAPDPVRRAGIFHAGVDEASGTVARALPAAHVSVFDFHDAARRSSPSLRRARTLGAAQAAGSVALDRLPLPAGGLDLVLLVFAAHELRSETARVTGFRELGRVLAPAGRILVVEHLRDGWNFAAFGPGAFHFLPRGAWLRCFREARLTLVRESACTPFVRVFELGRPA